MYLVNSSCFLSVAWNRKSYLKSVRRHRPSKRTAVRCYFASFRHNRLHSKPLITRFFAFVSFHSKAIVCFRLKLTLQIIRIFPFVSTSVLRWASRCTLARLQAPANTVTNEMSRNTSSSNGGKNLMATPSVSLRFLPRPLRRALLDFQKDGVRFGIRKQGR